MRRRNSWTAYLFAIVFVSGIYGCTSTQTSTGVTAPSSQKCQIQVSNAPSTFTDTGGTGSLSISATRDCSWSITSTANWVSIPSSSATGQGDASISYSVSANSIPQTRSASIAVQDQTVQLTQAAAPCRYALNKTSDVAPYTGGMLSVTLSTLTGCAWTTSSDSGWLVPGAVSGNASAVVSFSVGANSGPQRAGHALVGGQSYTVTQDAAPPPPSVPAPSPPPAPSPASVSGRASAVSGRCPNVAFAVSGQSVSANAATAYTSGRCTDIRNNVEVSVTGTTQTGGAIAATSIAIRK